MPGKRPLPSAARCPPNAADARFLAGRGRVRRTVETLVLLCVAALIGRTWFLQGLLVPYQVTSGSMAETLLGPHWEVACGDCGLSFVCGSDGLSGPQWAVCPNCGYAENRLDGQPEIAGDRLILDRLSCRIGSPRRWDVVAFRAPDSASKTYVKRVVGLPGESVRIRHGDVYVDGAITRKSLAQQRAMAILVHDARWAPRHTAALPPRWHAEADITPWLSRDGCFFHPEVPEAGIDWLTYHHWERVPGEPGRAQPSPVLSRSCYNPQGASRDLYLRPVADLLLGFRVVGLSGEGRLLLRATDGRESFQVQIHPAAATYELSRNGRPIQSGAFEGDPSGWTNVRVEVSLVDRQFLVAVDGRTAALSFYDGSDSPSPGSDRPFSIGVQDLELTIDQPRIYRDVYYDARPMRTETQGPDANSFQLGGEEYLVLGDNDPISQDSRSWPHGPGVPADLLEGKPLLVHLPMRGVSLGGCRFQVPDLGKIRYIR